MTFSKKWTNEERLKIVKLLAEQIQTDILAGHYGAATKFDERGVPTEFRPNMQSIIEVVYRPASVLEGCRESLEQLVDEHFEKYGDEHYTKQKFYEMSIEQARALIEKEEQEYAAGFSS